MIISKYIKVFLIPLFFVVVNYRAMQIENDNVEEITFDETEVVEEKEQKVNKFPYIEKFKITKNFICSECSKKYVSKNGLRRHEKIHSENWPLICDCGFRAAFRSSLTAHKIKHSTDAPFSCTDCTMTFKSKHRLEQHKNSHSVIKLFPCPFQNCEYAGKRKFNLLMHLQARKHKTIIHAFFKKCPHKDAADLIQYIKENEL